mgnify:CR=1
MRVAACIPLYPPTSRVGAWLSTHQCLVHLRRLGHDVEVARLLAARKPDYEIDDIPVHSGPGWRQRLIDAADIAISHLGDTGRTHSDALDAGVPSVRMAHGGVVRPGQLERAALVVWNSETYRDGRPGIVVHPPVWPERYATTPGDHVTLVNLSEDKGVKTFWRCAEQLPALRFLGVRGGIGRQVVPRARNVEVHPGTGDMREVYGRTRVLLAPSLHETWGRVGVEAMASGIPVIAHPTPGLRESLGEAGVFVDRDDVDGWVAEIERLQDPAEWAAASVRALARSAELHPAAHLDRFARAIESLKPVPA